MALNVLGDEGSLFFAAGIDLNQLQKDAAQIPNILEKVMKEAAVRSGVANKEIADSLAKSIQANPHIDDSIFDFVKKEQEKLRQGFADSAKYIDPLLASLDKLNGKNIGTGTTAQGAALKQLLQDYEQLEKGLEDYLAAVHEFNQTRIKASSSQPVQATSPSVASSGLSGMDEESQSMILNVAKLNLQLKDLGEQQAFINAEYQKGNISAKAFQENTAAIAAEVQEVNNSLKQLIATQKAYDESNAQGLSLLGQRKAALAGLSEGFKDLQGSGIKSLEAIEKKLTELQAHSVLLRANGVDTTALDASIEKAQKEIADINRSPIDVRAGTVNLAPLSQALATVSKQIESISGEVLSVKFNPVDVPKVQAAIDGLQSRIDSLRNTAIQFRVSGFDTASIDASLDKLQQRVNSLHDVTIHASADLNIDQFQTDYNLILKEAGKLESVSLQMKAAGIDTTHFDQDIASIKTQVRDAALNLKINLDAPDDNSIDSLFSGLKKKIDALKASAITLKVGDVDTDSLTASLQKAEGKLTALKGFKITGTADFNDESFQKTYRELTAEVATLEHHTISLKAAGLDTKEVEADIRRLREELVLPPVEVPIKSGSVNNKTETNPLAGASIDDTLLNKSLSVLDALDEETQAFIKDLIKLKAQLKEVEQAQATLNQEYGAGKVSNPDYQTAAAGLSAQQKGLQQQLDQLIEKQKQYDSTTTESVGYLNQKKAALAALKKEYGDLTEAEIKDAQVGGQLKQAIAGLQQEINGLSFNAVNESGQKTASMLAQLRKLKQQLAETPITDPGYGKLFEQASELKDKIGDLNQAIALSSSDTAGFDALAQGLRGVAAGFAAVEGVASLFTDDQAKIQQATRNVAAALTILNGVQEITNILDKNSALNVYLLSQYRKLTATSTAAQAVATEGLAVAEVTQAAATEGATVATEGLNVAMEANPAGILLLAITAVIGAIAFFSSGTEDAKEKQKAMNDALSEADDLLKQLAYGYSTVDAQATQKAENAVALAQAQGKSEKEILDLREKALKTKKYENDVILYRLGMNKKQLENEQNMLNSANEELKTFQDLIAAGEKLTDVQKERMEAVKVDAKSSQTKIDTAKPLIQDNENIQLQLAEQAAAAQKKAGEDGLKSAAALAEARLLLAKKNTAAEYAASVEAIRARTRVELADVNLTSGERAKALAQENKDLQDAAEKYHTLQLSNEKALILAKLDTVKKGSADELKLRLELLNNSAAAELAQSGVTEERRKQIKADTAKAIADETKKYNYDTTAAEINAVISSENARLAAIKAGSGEELSLKKDLVSQKALLDIATAKNSIDNEQAQAAKITEINAKALEDRRKLDDEYIQHVLDNRTKQINYETDLANVPLQGTADSPLASDKDKSAAQLQILINSRAALLKEMGEVEKAIGETDAVGGDDTKLLEKRNELWLKILAIINQINNGVATADEKAGAKIVSDLSKLAGVFNSIGDGVSGLNEKLGSSLKFIGSMVSSLASAKQSLLDFNKAKQQKDAVGQIAGLGGVVASAVGIAGAVVGIFTKAAEERKKLLAEIQQFQTNVFTGEVQINELYRQRTLEQAKLNKLRIEGIYSEIAALQSSKPQIQSDYDKVFAELQKQTAKVVTKNFYSQIYSQADEDKYIQKLLDAGMTIDQINEKYKNLKDTFANISLKNLNYQQLEDLFTKGQLDDKAKALFQTLQQLKKEGADVDAQLEEAKQKAQEVFAGTTADSIVDSIADGFSQGLRSVQDFGDKTEDIIRGAMLNALKYQALEEPIKKLFEQFAADAESNGGLDQTEIANFTDNINKTIKDAAAFTEQVEMATGLSLSKSTSNSGNSLAGSIKGITEQTAEVLAGRLGGIQLTAIEQLNICKNSLDVYLRIERNTAAAVIELSKQTTFWQSVTTPGGKKINI